MNVTSLPTRQEVEAALLDEWRLEGRLELLTDDASTRVASDATEGDARNTLFIIARRYCADKVARQAARRQVGSAENPHYGTRRIITDVRILASEGETILIAANPRFTGYATSW